MKASAKRAAEAEVRVEFWRKHPARLRLTAPLSSVKRLNLAEFPAQTDWFVEGKKVTAAEFKEMLKTEKRKR